MVLKIAAAFSASGGVRDAIVRDFVVPPLLTTIKVHVCVAVRVAVCVAVCVAVRVALCVAVRARCDCVRLCGTASAHDN